MISAVLRQMGLESRDENEEFRKRQEGLETEPGPEWGRRSEIAENLLPVTQLRAGDNCFRFRLGGAIQPKSFESDTPCRISERGTLRLYRGLSSPYGRFMDVSYITVFQRECITNAVKSRAAYPNREQQPCQPASHVLEVRPIG
uniref:Uncharacterized protein n=1 Tax=Sphaerodactylus townsendi TaxID=933632 RepID=A0ACB8E668_9SAUR